MATRFYSIPTPLQIDSAAREQKGGGGGGGGRKRRAGKICPVVGRELSIEKFNEAGRFCMRAVFEFSRVSAVY